MADDIRDREYMARAIQLARRGLCTTHPNPRVGCVIVQGESVVGEGWHERAGEAHAEIMALKAAGEKARGATAYVTLEPCAHQGRTPPCSQALIKAGVARVVVAMPDPNPPAQGGLKQLEQAGIHVDSGVLCAQAEALNRGFVSRVTRQRPWVTVKLGMTLDGRTAAPNGQSQWITDSPARADVHRLRAEAGCVLTGSATVLADNPSLNVRLPQCEEQGWPQPLRVVLDSQLRTPPGAQLFRCPGPILLLTASTDAARQQALQQADAQVVQIEAAAAGLSLPAAMQALAVREVNAVLVEAGPKLAGALLAQGLVDEVLIYMAPSLLGDAAPGLLHLPGLQQLADKIELDILQTRMLGRDLRIRARPLPAAVRQ